jgi:hypothetical protein
VIEEVSRHICHCLQRTDCAYELPRYTLLHSQRHRKVPRVEEPTRTECPPHRLFRGSLRASSPNRIIANHHVIVDNHLSSMLEHGIIIERPSASSMVRI